MRMDGLSFTTFLKIALVPTTQGKLGQLQRMHSGEGGYDFYKRMKLAAREVGRGVTPPSQIIAELSTIKREAERSHNVLMATRFVDWWVAEVGAIASPDRPKGRYKNADMSFDIRLTPELAHTRDDTLYVTYLWATNAPRLTRQVAGVGLHILKTTLAKGKFQNAKFQILDLRQRQVLGEELITNQTVSIMNADIAQIESMWRQITG